MFFYECQQRTCKGDYIILDNLNVFVKKTKNNFKIK
jgi:hypothetical protein